MNVARTSPLWTVEQLRWLAVLELKPWMHGALPESASAYAAHEIELEKPAKLAPAVREFRSNANPPPSRPAAPPRDDALAFDKPAAPSRPSTTPMTMPDKLHFALIRASGLNPNAQTSQAIISAWPPSSALRADPQAKRALWKELRALRKAARLEALLRDAKGEG